MQNIDLWLAVDRLRALAAAAPEGACELSDLIELIRGLDGTHDSTADCNGPTVAPGRRPAAGGRKTADPSDKLDEALACLRKYRRQNAVDTQSIETGLRDLRSRLATPTRELAPAEA